MSSHEQTMSSMEGAVSGMQAAQAATNASSEPEENPFKTKLLQEYTQEYKCLGSSGWFSWTCPF